MLRPSWNQKEQKQDIVERKEKLLTFVFWEGGECREKEELRWRELERLPV